MILQLLGVAFVSFLSSLGSSGFIDFKNNDSAITEDEKQVPLPKNIFTFNDNSYWWCISDYLTWDNFERLTSFISYVGGADFGRWDDYTYSDPFVTTLPSDYHIKGALSSSINQNNVYDTTWNLDIDTISYYFSNYYYVFKFYNHNNINSYLMISLKPYRPSTFNQGHYSFPFGGVNGFVAGSTNYSGPFTNASEFILYAPFGWEPPYSNLIPLYVSNDFTDTVSFTQGFNSGYQEGVINGNEQGYNQGYAEGNTNGYQTGYAEGIEYAESVDTTASTIFSGIIEVGLLPVNVLLQIFNFELFGINLAGVVSALLSVLIFLIIYRLVLGGKNDNS